MYYIECICVHVIFIIILWLLDQPIEEVSPDDQTDESTRVHFRGQTNPSYGATNLNVPS